MDKFKETHYLIMFLKIRISQYIKTFTDVQTITELYNFKVSYGTNDVVNCYL